MIPNQWYAVLESSEIPARKVVGMTRMGEKMVFWRNSHGQVSCMSDLCPHRGVMLSSGKICNDHIQCPFHGFEYDVSGACQFIPANGKNAAPPKAMKVRTYPVREEHGLIYIWWGEDRSEYPPVPFFESIGDDFVYATLKDHWPIHYSRAIENQLDVVHLPFVHYNTIGRGHRSLVNGPLVREESLWPEDNLFNLWVYNEYDDGQPPKRASELPEPTRRPFLQFRMPNVWQNWISDNIRIFIAFVPIDNENTLMYIRYYHKVRTPILKQLNGWLGSLGNLVIERQDKRVVITQRPMRSDLDIGEKLIPGDNPIIAYRKKRRKLIEAAEQK
jgi:phenylpropionate dioxygenase-like ring-hydroxylating dioxygenase large terminal subunit